MNRPLSSSCFPLSSLLLPLASLPSSSFSCCLLLLLALLLPAACYLLLLLRLLLHAIATSFHAAVVVLLLLLIWIEKRIYHSSLRDGIEAIQHSHLHGCTCPLLPGPFSESAAPPSPSPGRAGAAPSCHLLAHTRTHDKRTHEHTINEHTNTRQTHTRTHDKCTHEHTIDAHASTRRDPGAASSSSAAGSRAGPAR